MSYSLLASMRALHWVLKVGNLRNAMTFYENVIGLRVLRHEEFPTGCDATCNGPYGGAWSKTMVGFVPESEGFALELTYNYGIDEYASGNDLQYIAFQSPSALTRAKALGYEVDGTLIRGPDGYKYKVLEPLAGRQESFVAVGLRVADLEDAKDYWIGVLGLSEQDPVPGLESEYPNAMIGFSSDQTMLQLIQVNDGKPVDHALSGGRIAFACDSVLPIFDKVTRSHDKVHVPPLTLPTPGKADVVVTILMDRDDYEICFVEDIAFYDLATPKFDVIDWKERASQGGDGAELPTAPAVIHDDACGIVDILTVDEAETALASAASAQQTVVMYFCAGWSKNCLSLEPVVEYYAKQCAEKVNFLSVDVEAAAPQVMEQYGVSVVPHYKVFVTDSITDDEQSKMKLKEEYQGHKEIELREFLTRNTPTITIQQ